MRGLFLFGAIFLMDFFKLPSNILIAIYTIIATGISVFHSTIRMTLTLTFLIT